MPQPAPNRQAAYDKAVDLVAAAGEIRSGAALTKLLVELRRLDCVIAETMRAGIIIPDDHVVLVSVLETDTLWKKDKHGELISSTHWEAASARRTALSPTAVLLDQICAAGGGGHPVDEMVSAPADDTIRWHHVVERLDLGGSRQLHHGDREEPHEEHALGKAQTRARKRAIRGAFGIPSQYQMGTDGSPVVVCRLEYRHVQGKDPEFDKMVRKARFDKEMRAQAALYGRPQLAQPAEEPQAAPQAAVDAPPPQEPQEDPEQVAARQRRARLRDLVSEARAKGIDDDGLRAFAEVAQLVKKSPTDEALRRFAEQINDWAPPQAAQEPPPPYADDDDEDVPF
jgi:hypothetical protein